MMSLRVISRFGVLLYFRPQIQPIMKKIAINTTADDDAVVIIAIKLSRARPAGKKACMMTMVITNNAKLIIIKLFNDYLCMCDLQD